MGLIEMSFGRFDYLGDLTKLPKFHPPNTIGRGPTRGQSTQVDSCRFLCFYCHYHCYLFFLELVYQSDSTRDSKFFTHKGCNPISTRAFLWGFTLRIHNFGGQGQNRGKIAPIIIITFIVRFPCYVTKYSTFSPNQAPPTRSLQWTLFL